MTLPVLYILIRNDMASMNPGKLAAQASHAANAFIFRFNEQGADTETHKAIYSWQNQTVQGFGTVLVLEGSMLDIRQTIEAFKEKDYMADVIHDPTYPIVDGDVVHHIPLDTSAYVFVSDKHSDFFATSKLSTFKLHH